MTADRYIILTFIFFQKRSFFYVVIFGKNSFEGELEYDPFVSPLSLALIIIYIILYCIGARGYDDGAEKNTHSAAAAVIYYYLVG